MSDQTFQEYPESAELPFLQRMLNQFTGLSKDILIYGISGSLGQLFVLFTVPILTRVLTVGEFGALDVIYAVNGYLILVMSFNIGAGLWRYYYEVSADERKDRQRMVSSLFWFVLSVGLPIALVIASFSQELSFYLFDTGEYTLAIRFAVLSMPVTAIYYIFIGIQRMKRRPINYLIINLGYSILYLILVVILVGILRIGLQGIFLAQLIAYSVAALVTIWLARDLLGFTFSKDWFFKMAAYGLPMLPAALLSWSLIAINRFILNNYVGVVQLGYYSLAGKITLAMSLVVSSFTLAWQPFMLSNLKSADARRLYVLTLNYYTIFTLLFAAGITIFAREIVLIIATPAYMASIPLICILLFRYILPGAEYITGVGIVISKKTIYTSLALAAAVVANLLVTLVLTPRYGILGAAFAEIAGFLVGGIVIFLVSQRLYPVDWNLRVISQSLLGYVGVAILSILLLRSPLSLVWFTVLRIAILSLYAAFLLRLIEPDQRKMLYALPRQVYVRVLERIRASVG